MSDKRKPREFWIADADNGGQVFYAYTPCAMTESEKKEELRVIEHSAYADLEAQALKLEAALEKIVERGHDDACSYYMSSGYKCACQVRFAKTALAEFKKWRGEK